MFKRNCFVFSLIVSSLAIATFSLNSFSPVKAIDPEPKANLISTANNTKISDKKIDETKIKSAVFAGGCFWGMEAVFEHVKGVTNVVSGYSGGTAKTASYQEVSSGQTEHAESIKISYDPSQISYEQLLQIYFYVAHDPTQLNRQGPDRGKQYRSAIFFANDEQKLIADTYIERLNKSKNFAKPVVTKVAPLQEFYPAEDYHQDFITHNPNYPYVVIHDLPKLAQLQKQFPEIYKQ